MERSIFRIHRNMINFDFIYFFNVSESCRYLTSNKCRHLFHSRFHKLVLFFCSKNGGLEYLCQNRRVVSFLLYFALLSLASSERQTAPFAPPTPVRSARPTGRGGKSS